MSKYKKHYHSDDDCGCHDEKEKDYWGSYNNHGDDCSGKKKDDKDKDKDKDKDNDKDKKDHTDNKDNKDKKDGKDGKDKKDHHKPHPPHHKTCVKEVLAAIHEAQSKVKKRENHKPSGKDSIKEMLNDPKKPKKNTIPFMLYCDCELFKGTGVTTFDHSKKTKFACVSSFVFRLKELEGKCAVLELLTFKSDHDPHNKKKHSACDQIHCEDASDLKRTGIYITVDLSSFSAVTLLPAMRL